MIAGATAVTAAARRAAFSWRFAALVCLAAAARAARAAILSL